MAADLTQRELAAAIGSNQATIHQLERLLRAAYPKTVRKLCAALDAEPVDLLCAEGAEEE
jgi:transcriptional regulator with XRE-family HTH domain